MPLCVHSPHSSVVWMENYIVLGGKSGDLHIWEADTLTEVTRHKAHSGTALRMYMYMYIHTASPS